MLIISTSALCTKYSNVLSRLVERPMSVALDGVGYDHLIGPHWVDCYNHNKIREMEGDHFAERATLSLNIII